MSRRLLPRAAAVTRWIPSVERAACCVMVVVALACGGQGVGAEETTWSDADIAFFETKIRPVLVQHCDRCHSQAALAKGQLKGGLLVDTRAGLLKGGDSGPAITPGDSQQSLLLEALRYESFEMPPSGRLSDEIITDFEMWVSRGAADPRAGDAALPTRAIDMEAGRQHWAYQPLTVPPRRPASPAGGSPIDGFVDASLAAAGVRAVPSADRVTLARRVSFDLVGLPPRAEEVAAFVADDRPGAYERFVDRLLASPQFGVRWGRHWLDVARFAESVTLRGLVQHEAWRYRDYVIDAFNRDVPYAEFLRQQIAGDLLPATTLEQRQRQHIATTYLTLTDANLEDQDKEKLRMDVVDEQLTVIGQGLLGMTIGCARCHDHKFDPIPTSDYYALAGILSNVQTLEHANVSRWRERPLPLPAELEARLAAAETRRGELQSQIVALEKRGAVATARIVASESLPGVVLDDEQAVVVGQWKRSTSVKPFVNAGYQHDENSGRGEKSATFKTTLPAEGTYEVRLGYTPGTNRSRVVHVTVMSATGDQTVTVNQQTPPPIDGLFVSLGRYEFESAAPAEVVVSNRDADGHVVIDAIQFLPVGPDLAARDMGQPKPAATSADDDVRKERLGRLKAELSALQAEVPKRPLFQGVEEMPEIRDAHVNIRGNVHQLGPQVPRGFLQVVSLGDVAALPADESGRRQLGDWLADARNPLPARVYANRVWHWLFGAGIVPTVDNLGTTGLPPSHPELLEYLAGRFVEQGGSTKSLVREIVLSRAYQRGSGSQPEQAAIDPENRLLWRMNRKRLEAESLLDAVLTLSGDLDGRMEGKTIPDDLSADYGFVHDSRRRAIYWPHLRNALPELIRTFDGANPSLVSGQRNVSSVAPQALYLMNSPWILERCEQAARRLIAEVPSESERVQQAFIRALGRPPTAEEEQTVVAFLSSHNAGHGAGEQELLWMQIVQSLLGSVDFRYLH